MSPSLFGVDWRKSDAHLLFLSKFLSPKTADDFAKADSRIEAFGDFAKLDTWKSVLGESPSSAIRRFVDEGMLGQADIGAQLDYKFKATELKAMLKQRGLPVSGRKEDLISRLLQADVESMKRAVAGLKVFLCSERGREIAEQFLLAEKAKRANLEEQVLGYLKQRKFKEASSSVASYEAKQVFSRGIGEDWKNHDPSRHIEMLKFMFDGRPKILSRLNDDELAALRLAAGMMFLFGTNQGKKWLPLDFETCLAMDNDSAVRQVLFYARHQANIVNYRQSSVIKQVEILATEDSCEACKKMSGKRYKLDRVPELPCEHCTHEMGCRCNLLPIVE